MKTQSNEPWLSIIIPSRHNIRQLSRFFDSLLSCTNHPNELEVILVVDEDDRETADYSHPVIDLVKVICRPGSNMGSLNQAGYQASRGRYLMLLNDDVEIKTKGWDVIVRDCLYGFLDEIVLIHVNDLIFKEKLCVFPLVSRFYCELADGICPPDYQRYKIDDHVYNVFELLALLRHRRIVYLPDVIFHHLHYRRDLKLRRIYHFNEKIMIADGERFDALLPQRKLLAQRLAAVIREKIELEQHRLDGIRLALTNDQVPLSGFSHQRQAFVDSEKALQAANLSICLIEPWSGYTSTRLQASLAQEKLGVEIITLNCPIREIGLYVHWNRLLSMASGDYLLILNGEIEFQPGWLLKMWMLMGPRVGMVFSLRSRQVGGTDLACKLLLDMAKVGFLRFSETYEGPLAIIDYALRVWECGFSVVDQSEGLTSLSPTRDPMVAREPNWKKYNNGISRFRTEWLESKRLASLDAKCDKCTGWPAWKSIAEDYLLQEPSLAGNPCSDQACTSKVGQWYRLKCFLRKLRIPRWFPS